MKKITSVLVALVVLVSVFAFSASAAGAINTYEQKVLDYLSQHVQLGKTDFKIPDEYINQAKNYFLTIDMTEDQANDVIGHVNEGIEVLKSCAVPDKDFDMKILPQAKKADLLKAGQDASAVTGANLTYDVSSEKVVITVIPEGSNVPVVIFSDEPIVKATGSSLSASAVILTAGVMALALCVVVAASKKANLF